MTANNCRRCQLRRWCEHPDNESFLRELAGEPRGYAIGEKPETPVQRWPRNEPVIYKQPPKAAEHD